MTDDELKADITFVLSYILEMERRIIILFGALTVIVACALLGALHAWPPH